ncbi:hypothetical protein DBO86_24895 [Pseudomonas indoloxydans]|uniref:Uncharacterized protein n=1 Tax=Ectopseudomonas oleovorans TaxID=301 RepID=A0A2T5PE99_ECTOL|nr:hypothetical protein DBO86_24895 [Pseudomonas indoloxydans]RRW39099.1 hypothetical protein EGJ44_01635 [Pseudomonas oleovorans]
MFLVLVPLAAWLLLSVYLGYVGRKPWLTLLKARSDTLPHSQRQGILRVQGCEALQVLGVIFESIYLHF